MSMLDYCEYSPRLECGYGHNVRSPGRSTLLVTNLADVVDEEYLTDIFSEQCIETCREGSKPQAYVNVQSHKGALHACKFDGRVVKGRAMEIYLKN